MAALDRYPKSIRKQIRTYAGKAYSREMHNLLEQLDHDFSEWREGRMESEDLDERIHQYHNRDARELFVRYNSGPYEDILVVHAFLDGILDQNEAPPELLEALADTFELIRRNRDRTKNEEQ